MAASAALQQVLAGELLLTRTTALLDLDAVRRCCEPLLQLALPHPAWARTPWGRTLPRSCVGATVADYRACLAARPMEPAAALERHLVAPLAAWLQQLFALPLQPLRDDEGQPLPSWALRVMDEGQGIAPHCEQVWNPLNLVESGQLGAMAFEPAVQLSYLYVLEAPAQGGELELFDHRGPVRPTSLTSTGLVPPVPGELLLFNAGLHWHRICPCQGPGRRVVLGGFVRLNSAHTALHAYV